MTIAAGLLWFYRAMCLVRSQVINRLYLTFDHREPRYRDEWATFEPNCCRIEAQERNVA